MKKVRVRTLNQPNSVFPWEIDLSAQSLSELLGWRPDGEAILSIVDQLERGYLVEPFTKVGPREKGTDGVKYQLIAIEETA